MSLSVDAPDTSPSRTVFAGVKDALGLASITIAFSLVGIGGLVRDVGYPMFAGVLSTLLMWAGPAQVLLFGGIASGTALPIIAVAVLFSSLRFLPMTMSIMPLVNSPVRPTWQLLLAAHLIAITNWAEGIRRLPDIAHGQRYWYFMGFGTTVLVSGAIATGAGYYLVAALPVAFAAALLFTTPMFFTVNLVAAAKRSVDWLPIVLSWAGIVVLTPLVGSDYDLVVAGLGGGTLAYVIARILKRRSA